LSGLLVASQEAGGKFTLPLDCDSHRSRTVKIVAQVRASVNKLFGGAARKSGRARDSSTENSVFDANGFIKNTA
jgi:hypothetical protein